MKQMSRRSFLGTSAAAGAVAMLGPQALGAAADGRPPNVVLLLADDMRWDTLSCIGHPVVRTPHLDALARDGVLFENAFVTTSICMASRASIFTGLYTRSHGVDDFRTTLSPRLMNLSYFSQLRRAGYRTGFMGKWGVGKLPVDAFDVFEAFPGQGAYFEDGRDEHLTNLQAEQAEQFLRGCRHDQPFCLSLSFKAPHAQDGADPKFPYDPALEDAYAEATIPRPATLDDSSSVPPFIEQTLNRTREGSDWLEENYDDTMRAIYRLIDGIDRAVGRIMTALAKLGLDQNTIVIFTSDNGYMYGEHGRLGGKWLMYEESVRVPLIVRDPRQGAAQRDRRVAEMALNIDLAPTMLDLAGIGVPPAMQGRSLTPLLRGEASDWREDWFYEHTYRGHAIAATEGIRSDRWKYVRYVDEDPPLEQLFDLQNDPHERRDLAGHAAQAPVLQHLRARWQAWLAALDSWSLRSSEPWREPEVAPSDASG
jgi:arylsulfatase A-like enzyme